MEIRKTSALVESGILAAVAIVFAMVGAYVPVLSLFANFIWPLPIILCGRRHGLKWSFLCLMVSGIIVAIIVSPLHALSVVAVFGLIGLTLGECLRCNMSPIKLLLVGSVGSLIACIFSMLIGYFLMNINLLQVFIDSMNQGYGMSLDFYKQMGYTDDQLREMTEEVAIMKKMVLLIMPGAFLLVAPLTVFVNFWAARKVLNKLGDHYPWFPPFSRWDMPRFTLLPYGMGIILLWRFDALRDSIYYQLGFNLFVLSSVFLLLQALTVVYWFVETKGKPKWWFSLAVTAVFFSQLLSQIAVLLGAYDLVIDFRKLRPRSIKK